MKRFFLRAGVCLCVLFLLCLASGRKAEARENVTTYVRNSGYYTLKIFKDGQLIGTYRADCSVGSSIGNDRGESYIPTSLTLLDGMDCIRLKSTPTSFADTQVNWVNYFPWNRQYVFEYLYHFTTDMTGYHFGHAAATEHGQMGAGAIDSGAGFYIHTDTNEIGMTNWGTIHGGGFYHATFCVYIDPNTYTIHFDTNNPNSVSDIGIDRTSQTALYKRAWGALPVPSKPGYRFLGWYDAKTGGNQVTSAAACWGDCTVYAHWEPIEYLITFHPNEENGTGTVTGTMPTVRLTYDQMKELPANVYEKTTIVPNEDEGGSDVQKPSVFLGWSANPRAPSPSYQERAKVMNLTTSDSAVIHLYAIWDDAPKFTLVSYPDRYFTLEEAKSGAITEEELLKTVVVYDRETNLLPPVPGGGDSVGVTVVGYDPDEFLNLTDDSSVSIRYKVTDNGGNKGFVNIHVHVSRNGGMDPDTVSYLRSISDTYASEEPDEGGLAADSKWKTDPAYAASLSRAFGSSRSYDLTFNKSQLERIRRYVDTHGFGNSESRTALNEFWANITH